MDLDGALKIMIPPGQRRPVWRGGIVQIHVTRACDLACTHCTQGSNLAGKPVVMTPDEFAQALDSLEGYWGVIGVFGGNPTLSPYFDDYCRILRARVPFEQRGLWSNHPRGKGAQCRITFNPRHSNINVHQVREAADEWVRDWPEIQGLIKGLDQDSIHSAPFVAIQDLEPDESRRWDLISRCDINRYWSALVGIVPGRGLRAYFCEIAYSQAVLHAQDPAWPDTGLEARPGWWKLPMQDFRDQVQLHCQACGIPLRRQGLEANASDFDQASRTHFEAMKPKSRDHRVELVEIGGLVNGARPATQYLPGVTPGYQGA